MAKLACAIHKAYLNEMKFFNLMVEVPRISEFFRFFRSSFLIILSTYHATTNELVHSFIRFKTDNKPFARHDPSVFEVIVNHSLLGLHYMIT